MAQTVEACWPDALERLSGCVVTRYGHGLPTRRIRVIEAGHPLPDAAGQQAAEQIRAAVQGLSAADLVLMLASGGGSALLAEPLPGVTLADKRALTQALLLSGARIEEINCVRKHLSGLKGGHLALAAWPARVLTLAISDVPGNDPATIASGPTVPDPTTCAEALDICARYRVTLPAAVHNMLASGAAETPKPDDPRFSRCTARIVASGQMALTAAAAVATQHGITPLILGDAIEGEAREVACVLGGIALSCAADGVPLAPPCVLLSGGETTVRVTGQGCGGRNSEFLLALALMLRGAPRVHALAADTDGIDGMADNAGACLAPDTLARAAAAGLDCRDRLLDNDAHSVFAALDDLLVTGPTCTNVNDFRAILIT
jgi:hydroxypyruvate reductase